MANVLSRGYDRRGRVPDSDEELPHMGGRELADKLRSRIPDLKVIFMSGYTDDAIVRQGLEHDKTPFQQKPFLPSALVNTVRKVLDNSLVKL
jgi:CheY-like chemotaxis protein